MLEARQYALLKHEAARSSLSVGELVRRAVDKTYRPFARPTLLGFELNLGVWRRIDAAVIARRVRPH